MARASTSDCVFCDPEPCTCDITPSKAKVSAAQRKMKPAPLVGKPADQQVAPPVTTPQKVVNVVVTPQLTHTVSREELEFNVTIQALESVLDDDERRTYSHILDRRPTRDEKILAWQRLRRYRRG